MLADATTIVVEDGMEPKDFFDRLWATAGDQHRPAASRGGSYDWKVRGYRITVTWDHERFVYTAEINLDGKTLKVLKTLFEALPPNKPTDDEQTRFTAHHQWAEPPCPATLTKALLVL